MKKNLISVAILALLLVNLVLTGIMAFSVMSTNKKTAQLVSDIATTINLEIATDDPASEEAPDKVSMKNIETYTISDMTIPLKKGVDEKDHYMLASVALSMNKEHPDFLEYGSALQEDLIKGEIIKIISSYTIDEAKANTGVLCEEILKKIQALYESDFIFDVTFSSTLYQ
ncbi:MAG: flagellar basal body-associated FliL family protein [Lachnospiraceae bacterium]|nr:flagellar basal body-associated FliL family protein [Lachnospiraceae bacterium]